MRERNRHLLVFKLGGVAAALSLISHSAHASVIIPPPIALPEPSTWMLLGGGVAAAVIVSRFRNRK